MAASVETRAPDWINFYRGDDWGRTLRHPMAPERLGDLECFIHHTAGSPYHHLTGPAAMRELQRFSHNRNYATVAYDVCVHYHPASGTVSILEGRGGSRSAATLDRNEDGEALCLFGYFHPGSSLSAHPTEREVEGAAWALAWMIEQGWCSPDVQALGHRDNPAHPGATACPGDFLYPRVGHIGARALEIYSNDTPSEGDDDMGTPYVVKPPTNRAGKPWFYVQGGSARVATQVEVDQIKAGQLDTSQDATDQGAIRYDLLHEQVLGRKP